MSAEHIGREQTVEVDGKTFILSRWDRGVWSEFLAWAKTQIPDPKAEAIEFIKALDKDDPLRADIVREALALKTQGITESSPAVRQLLGGAEGSTYLVWLLLRKHQPTATQDDAYDLTQWLGESLKLVLEKCSGKSPKKDDALGVKPPT